MWWVYSKSPTLFCTALTVQGLVLFLDSSGARRSARPLSFSLEARACNTGRGGRIHGKTGKPHVATQALVQQMQEVERLLDVTLDGSLNERCCSD